MPTVSDIAKRAGVSPATVSLALNGKPVSEKSLQKVLQAAEELNYYPKISARSLRSGKVLSIGFYVIEAEFNLEPNSGYLFPLVAGISRTLASAGYSMQFESITPENTGLLSKKAREHSVDGMIVLPHYPDVVHTLQRDILKDEIPIVFLQVHPSLDVYYAGVNHAMGTELALRHLYNHGHRNIAVIAGPKWNLDSQQRLDAYTEVARDLGLQIRDEWFGYGDFNIQGGYNCARAIVQQSEIPTAIFCLNDFMAVGAMHALFECGIRVPEHISVLGYDDSFVAEACFPQLTTIRQPMFEQGAKSAQMVLDILHGEPEPLKRIILEPKLIERASVTSR